MCAAICRPPNSNKEYYDTFNVEVGLFGGTVKNGNLLQAAPCYLTGSFEKAGAVSGVAKHHRIPSQRAAMTAHCSRIFERAIVAGG
jgi:hypothetical protein